MFPFYFPRQESDPEPDEEPGDDPVNAWRFEQLLEAGWDDLLASILAASDVDLHRACEVRRGCDQLTAWEIVRPW